MGYKNKIKEEVTNIVKEKLITILGNGVVSAMNYYLKSINSEIEKVYEEPEKFSEGLRKIFGEGAKVLEEEIALTICRKFEIFSEYINNIQSAINKLKEKYK